MEIVPLLCENVVENFNIEMDVCKAAREGQLVDIVCT